MNPTSLAVSEHTFAKNFCQIRQLDRRLSFHDHKRLQAFTSTFSNALGLQLKRSKKQKGLLDIQKRRRCTAEFVEELPFSIAIGACILNSMIFPLQEDGGKDVEKRSVDSSVMDENDVRYATMGIISFIPLFNWLAWVFAWLDTSQQRYLVYSIVYLAPYLRTGLSLSPDDSWLPIGSLLACIIHIQLEISVSAGRPPLNNFLGDASKFLYLKVRTQELRERVEKFIDRVQLAEKTGSLPSEVEKLELPSEQESAQEELLEFDKKLASSRRMEREELLKNSEEKLDDAAQKP